MKSVVLSFPWLCRIIFGLARSCGFKFYLWMKVFVLFLCIFGPSAEDPSSEEGYLVFVPLDDNFWESWLTRHLFRDKNDKSLFMHPSTSPSQTELRGGKDSWLFLFGILQPFLGTIFPWWVLKTPGEVDFPLLQTLGEVWRFSCQSFVPPC